MPTETTAPRLIDANALNEILEPLIDFVKQNIESESKSKNPNGELIQILKKIRPKLIKMRSAPTVETTDDVLARLPKTLQRYWELALAFSKDDEEFVAAYEYGGCWERKSFWKTPLEAVLRLEASLNPK